MQRFQREPGLRIKPPHRVVIVFRYHNLYYPLDDTFAEDCFTDPASPLGEEGVLHTTSRM